MISASPVVSTVSAGAEYDALDAAFARAADEEAFFDTLARWDALKRRITNHEYRSDLRFRQDTADEDARTANSEAAALAAFGRSRDTAIKGLVLAHALRGSLEARYGTYVTTRWETDVLAYDPTVEALAVREAALYDEYAALVATARGTLAGASRTLSELGAFAEDADRDVRHAAACAAAEAYAVHGSVLDRIYDDIVRLRTEMASVLGYPSYVELGYRRLGRTDYGADEVARFREAIERDIVPLAAQIVASQAASLGLDAVMPWDERVFDGLPPIAIPPEAALLAAFRDGFGALHPALGAFAERILADRRFDVEARPSKAAGGFCTFFYDERRPFIFANLNGTTNDVLVVVHEMGHAFQNDASRDKPLFEQIIPTPEAGEIHSMAMEYLMWDEYERFVGDDAERYRTSTLRAMLLMLPYVAAVDHFQHLVYERPEASPAERHAMWRDLERRYLPYRHDGGIPFFERGAMWQRQRHIYGFPFYYIDYGLAMCCALQFWVDGRRDRDAAVARYVALCERGGEAPFLDLVASAGLRSPFEAGALARVAAEARTYLGLPAQA